MLALLAALVLFLEDGHDGSLVERLPQSLKLDDVSNRVVAWLCWVKEQ